MFSHDRARYGDFSGALVVRVASLAAFAPFVLGIGLPQSEYSTQRQRTATQSCPQRQDAKSYFRYYCSMIFAFVLERIRRWRDATRTKSIVSTEEDGELRDPDNPFPEVVTIEFQDVIDLHSIPPKQVHAVVEDYLDEAHRRGVPFVRIIHGKGLGVQREMIRSILERTSFVSEFHDAPTEAGGWGATLVTLVARSAKG